MDIIEQVSRVICTSRGADPDAPLVIGRYRQVEVDGASIDYIEPITGNRIVEEIAFAHGWQGYRDIAEAIVPLIATHVQAGL